MKNQERGSQYSLSLSDGTKSGGKPTSETKVVPFVDAKTLEIRNTAVRRVAASGIFSLPENLRRG